MIVERYSNGFMTDELPSLWRISFFDLIESDRRAPQLKDASQKADLDTWTKLLTGIVVDSCRSLGWIAAAKGHRCKTLPISRSEYLSLDVMAFPNEIKGWQFPIAIFELENSSDPNIVSYALWKILCIRAPLRILFCYRPTPEEGSELVARLRHAVIKPISVEERVKVDGTLILCVGNRHHAGTFPYDFFRWWKFDKNTGNFTRM